MRIVHHALSILSFICISTALLLAEPATGPLRVCKENPRYFTDDSGKAIYLTGSHVWNNLIDMSTDDPPKAFDNEAYLNWMSELNHNFIRLWAWELVDWNTKGNGENRHHTISSLPWARTGPGNALDGKPKFDLTKFNPDYFERLKTRVEAARQKGIYVSIMLFEGWGVQFSPDAWKAHPFHAANNINGIEADQNGDGMGLEVHELSNPKITALQEAYIKRMIETVKGLDNVLYEISNENHPPSTAWQYHIINYIKQVEKEMPKQHPVGMTFQYKGGSNQTLFDSPADWISPNPDGGYRDNPPAADGAKVILTDTDHLWGIGGNQAWVWKSFTRGMNPLFMDPYDAMVLQDKPFDPRWDSVRKSLGYTLTFAKRMNLTAMTPQNGLASSGFCLANPGDEYLIYAEKGNEVTVDLSDSYDSFQVEWFNPNTAKTAKADKVSGGAKQTLKSPFGDADVVLYVKKSG